MKVNLSNESQLLLVRMYIEKHLSGKIVRNAVVPQAQVKRNENYLDCVILLDGSLVTVRANCFAHCQFLTVNKDKAEEKTVVKSKYAFPFCLNYHAVKIPAHLDNNKSRVNLVSYHVASSYFVNLSQAYYGVFETPLIVYKSKRFSFNKNQLVAGVELELPVYNRSKQSMYNNFWYVDNDYSQIIGDTEVQSIPMEIEYFTTGLFHRRLRTLYKNFVNNQPYVPKQYDYGNDNTNRGSGVHLHIGLSDSCFDMFSLRQALYIVAAERGGADFLKDIGGKKDACFQAYSDFTPTTRPHHKYQAFRVITNTEQEKRLEIRYMASDPDPDVVFGRIVGAVSLVEHALRWLEDREANELVMTMTKLSMLSLKR